MLNVDTNKCKKENGQENEKQGIPTADAKTTEPPGSQPDTTVLDCKAAQNSQIPYSATGSFNRQYQDRLFKAIFEREEHKD